MPYTFTMEVGPLNKLKKIDARPQQGRLGKTTVTYIRECGLGRVWLDQDEEFKFMNTHITSLCSKSFSTTLQ